MQLIKAKLRRTIAAWIYALVLAIGLFVVNGLARRFDASQSEPIAEVLYLLVAAFLVSLPQVRIERGHLDLSAIVTGAAAILVNPLLATIIGLVTAFRQAPRGSWRMVVNGLTYAIAPCLGAVVASNLRAGDVLPVAARVLVLVTVSAVNIGLVLAGLTIRTGESAASIARHNFTPSFYAAFAYFGLAALLLSYVLDGSAQGYLLATIVCILALALTDTIAGRRVRRVLESELSDADRHLFHSRAVEGVVHNLRNHVATAAAYLKEIDPRRLDPVDRESLETATVSANDAVTVLRSLSQGATPRVSYSVDPVDLNELVTRSLGMARPRARAKEVQLAVRESPSDVKVRADPLLMREVITNLLNNAIDAVNAGGHVELTTGRRANGWPYFSVGDDGPGISDDNRHRLFEPHFTTKEGGTGLGLFMSYGIVREHRGDLVYEGTRRGAVFTVVLPPFGG